MGMSLCIQGTDRDAVTLPTPPVLKKEASEWVCPFVVSWNRNVEGGNSFEQLCVQQYSTERQENGLVLLPCWAEASLGLSSLVWQLSSILFLEGTETRSSCFNQQEPQMLDFKCRIPLTSLVTLLLQGRLHEACTGNKAYAEKSAVFHRALCKCFCGSVFLSATSFTYGSSPLLMASASVSRLSCFLV